MTNTLRLSVGSVGRALHGQRILRRNGYRSWVHRRTEPSREGCGYTLDVAVRSPDEQAAVLRLLAAAGITPSAPRESGWGG